MADLELGEIFQIVSLSRRSGTLQLNTQEASGEIIFTSGRVVAAYRTDQDASLGECLIEAGLLSPASYQEMLAAQSGGTAGDALLRQFGVEGESYDAAVENLLKRMIYGMFEWREGTFSFVLDEKPDPWRGFRADGMRIVCERGLSPQYLAIEGARQRDEESRGDDLDAFLASPGDDGSLDMGFGEFLFDEEIAEAAAEASPSQAALAAAEMKVEAVPEVGGGVAQESPISESFAPAQEEEAAGSTTGSHAGGSPVFAPEMQEHTASVIPFPAGGRRRERTSAAADIESPPSLPQPEMAAKSLVPPADAAAEAVATSHPSGRQFLVIDDDPQVVSAISEALRGAGASVISAGTVAEAFEILARVGPELVVVCDMIIARSDGRGILGGVEILERLRERWPTLPCVLFTDYQNEEAEARVHALNAFAVLTKPRKAQIHGQEKQGTLASMRAFLDALVETLRPFLQAPQRENDVVLPPPAVPVGERAETGYDLGREVASELEQIVPNDAELPPAVASGAELTALRSLLGELRDPANREQVTLLVLRFASTLFERSALFLATRRVFVGLGGFSISERSEEFVMRVRRTQIKVSSNSIFDKVSRFRSLIRLRLDEKSEEERKLIEGLGGGWHNWEVVAAPLISGDRVAAVLYGDNPSGRPMGPTEGLEIFLQQAGLVMERALLERRLEESRRKKLERP